MAEGMDFFTRSEVNFIDLVDHVSQEITVNHAVNGALEDRRNDIATITSLTALQTPQVSEEPRAFRAVRAHGLLVVDKGDEFVAGDTAFPGCPIPPAIWRLNSGAESLSCDSRFLFTNLLHVVEK